MKQISTPPGALKFRLVAIVILVIIFMLAFLNYTNGISIALEKTSIQQTKNIINSTLAVVFATYTVKGELERLNEVNGGNPFEYLERYSQVPATYQGEISDDSLQENVPGWYYDRANGLAIYKPFYDDNLYRFTIVLEYLDTNNSGDFEADFDEFRHLSFKQLRQQGGETAGVVSGALY
jgi:hypothetical protein